MPMLDWPDVADLLILNFSNDFEFTCRNLDQAIGLTAALREKGLDVERAPYSARLKIATARERGD